MILGQHLSSIRPLLLHQEKIRPIQANSRIPIPFQNGLFEGSFLLMVNTNGLPPYCKKRFEGTKYTFEVQVRISKCFHLLLFRWSRTFQCSAATSSLSDLQYYHCYYYRSNTTTTTTTTTAYIHTYIHACMYTLISS